MNETEAAAAIASGALPSPLQFGSGFLVAIRISGTGLAERPAIQEIVWRDPEVWLSEETLGRLGGLPVILDHPEASALNTEEFANRSVGAVLLPYVADRTGIQNAEGPDVWGVARLFLDDAMVQQIEDRSTSPGVVFAKSDGNQRITLPDGTNCLVEGSPTLIDHIAIVMSGDGAGVWDKGGENSGIRFDNKGTNMTKEEMAADQARKDAEETARKDAEARRDEKIDKVLSHLNDVCGRLDKLEKRGDGRKDASEETEEEKAEREAQERKDHALRVAKDALKAREEDVTNGDAQARADQVAQAFGQRAPAPMTGERPLNYRKRLLRQFQRHSVFKDADLDVIALDAKSFETVEAQVYADALVASKTPTYDDDRVHYRTRTTESGHRITEGFGNHTVFKQLSQPTMRVTAFLTPTNRT